MSVLICTHLSISTVSVSMVTMLVSVKPVSVLAWKMTSDVDVSELQSIDTTSPLASTLTGGVGVCPVTRANNKASE